MFLQIFCPSLCMTCFLLLVMGLGLGFMFSSLRAPHCGFCAFKCALLFRLWSFLFSSLVPLLGVFPLFIYWGNRLKHKDEEEAQVFCLHLHGTLNISVWVCHHLYKLSPTLHKVLPLPLSWLPASHVSPSLTPQHLISQHWFSVSQNLIVATNTTLSFPKFFLGHLKCGHRFQMACSSRKFVW